MVPRLLSRLVLAAGFFISCVGEAAPPTLTDLGSKVRLENGQIAATISKSKAHLRSLRLNGDELLGNGGRGYLQVYVDRRFSTPERAEFRVVAQERDMIDVAHRWRVGPLEFDWHYVLRSSDSGIYVYLVAAYDPQIAPRCEIEQLSYVLRTDKEIFRRMHVDDDRVFDMPTPEEVAEGETLTPVEATRLADGTVDHKYHYSKMATDYDLHGWTGSGKGHWIVIPSNEYMNGGPTSQELTVHQTTKTPVSLRMIHAAHYGSGRTTLDESDGRWRKLFGPWLMYFNEGDSDQASSDAKQRLNEEKAAWPYAWLNHEAYAPAHRRGRVTGEFKIADGSDPKGALVVLAQPTDGAPETNWQRQGKDYLFWANAEKDGSFAIDHVRPGAYTLYASVSGVLGEYRLDGVEVRAGSELDLGELGWTPKRFGRSVWQVGTPDRSAGEFLHGDDHRRWGLWLEYPREFSHGVHYVVGESAPGKDWNFNQWCVENGENDAGRTTYATSPWSIEFDLDEVKADRGYLTVAIAAAREARLRVSVNETEVFDGPLVSDGAAHRAGIRGFYQEEIIDFDASLLRSDAANRIVLEQRRPGLFTSIMYDCVRLELGSAQRAAHTPQ